MQKKEFEIIESIKKCSFKKGDILFLNTKRQITDTQYKRIMELCRKVLPEGIKVLLLEDDLEIGILTKEKE